MFPYYLYSFLVCWWNIWLKRKQNKEIFMHPKTCSSTRWRLLIDTCIQMSSLPQHQTVKLKGMTYFIYWAITQHEWNSCTCLRGTLYDSKFYLHPQWLTNTQRASRKESDISAQQVRDSQRLCVQVLEGGKRNLLGWTGTGPLSDKKWHKWKKKGLKGRKVVLRFNAQTKEPLWRLLLSRTLLFRFKEKASTATWMGGWERGGSRCLNCDPQRSSTPTMSL